MRNVLQDPAGRRSLDLASHTFIETSTNEAYPLVPVTYAVLAAAMGTSVTPLCTDRSCNIYWGLQRCSAVAGPTHVVALGLQFWLRL